MGLINVKLRVKELAARKGVTLQEVAEAIGIKQNTLSTMIKTGRTSTKRIEALCAYFNITPNELIILDDEAYEENSPRLPKGHLTKNVSLDVNTIFDSIATLPPRKQKLLIEAMQKMVEAAF
jgi:DNA-binding Xre family transcriptional regulator